MGYNQTTSEYELFYIVRWIVEYDTKKLIAGIIEYGNTVRNRYRLPVRLSRERLLTFLQF